MVSLSNSSGASCTAVQQLVIWMLLQLSLPTFQLLRSWFPCCPAFVSLGHPSALTVKSMQEKATREKPFIVLNVATQGEVTWGGDSQPTHWAKQPAYIYLEKGCLYKLQHISHANEGACINHSTPCLQMEVCFCTNYSIVPFVPLVTLLD